MSMFIGRNTYGADTVTLWREVYIFEAFSIHT